MKILHGADFHFSRENQDRALRALTTFAEKGEEEQVDLFVIAGDLFDRPVNNTTSSGFPDLVRVIQQMMNVAPVVAVCGTPTHDIPGSYEAFQEIKAKHRFTLLLQGIPYFMDNFDVQIEGRTEHSRLLILGCPEPSKQWFLRDKQLGKEEANEAIKDGMRQLLLGMGAIRKQHADIPCVFLYHGTVAGASINESQVMPPGGIQIGKEDLALVGADYCALGHIHYGQAITGIRAEYTGSAFPVDWGEQEIKSFILSIIEKRGVSTKRIHYPFPPRKKVVRDWSRLGTGEDVEGYEVWLQIRARKEERNSIDTDAIFSRLIDAGAVMGSRVEVVTIPTETVRAAAISEATRLRDKVKVFADLSQEKASESVLEKADELEARAQEQGEAPTGLHIRIEKLILRGAIGIKKGTGLDQVEIDLDQYDPGLLALVGVNGSGKTTLIENMHPYPQMLTRSGKLQDHFCLKDSFRDLYFIDERSGIPYRAFMQIDGVNKSGSVEYFLYAYSEQEIFDQDGRWMPVGETNGRKESYVQEIERLFGSLPLFLRSAFVSQKQPKNLPDLSEATKGEKKALFRELGGLEYLQKYADLAKEEVADIAEETAGIRVKLERGSDIEKETKEQTDRKRSLHQDEMDAEAELKSFGDEGRYLRERSDELAGKVEKVKEARSKVSEINQLLHDIESEKAQLDEENKKYALALKHRDKAERDVQRYEELQKREGELNAEKAKVYATREALLAEYNDAKDAVVAAEKQMQTKQAEIKEKAGRCEMDRLGIKQQATQIDNELQEPVTENCPTCGQIWPASKKAEFEQKRVEKREKLAENQQKLLDFDVKLSGFRKEFDEIQAKIDALDRPDEPDLPEFDMDEFTKVQQELRSIEIDAVRRILREAQEADIRLQENARRLETLNGRAEKQAREREKAAGLIDETVEIEYRSVSQRLEETRQKYHEKDAELHAIRAMMGECEKNIEKLHAEWEGLAKLKKDLKVMEVDQAEWQYLQRACGPDGIQALELDAMGPGIADVANNILESAYGARFQVEFRTTRIGGSGSNTRQIEDFQIIVHDSETGDEQLLETLSGGESVWIKRAIYDAFGIIRARKTGTQFLTVFQDEADGALDPAAREHYFRMLERAHVEAGRHHTIVITHSTEAQEVIGQKIEMKFLKSGEREVVTA